MTFINKERTDIINDIIIKIVDNVRDISDINPGSVIRTLIEGLAQEVSLTYDEIQAVYEGTRILTATGNDLNNLGEIVGIIRTPGTLSTGVVTFNRETIINNDFIISQGSTISTNPAEGEQLFFTVDEDSTFQSQISENNHYIDGIFKYRLSERLIGLINSLIGTVGALSRTFLLNSDYQITSVDGEHIPVINSLVTIDDCDAVTGWTNSTGSLAELVTTTGHKQGTGMLNLGKSGSTTNTINYSKTLSNAINLLDKRLFLWFNIADSSTLNKISSIKIRLSSNNTPTNNYYEMSLINLKTGNNLYSASYLGSPQTGFPNVETINSVRIIIETNNDSDVISSGDIAMDYWHASESERPYYGDVIEWLDSGTQPNHDTSFVTIWNPLSVDANVSSTVTGEGVNVSANKIVYKVDLIPNITSLTNYYGLSSGTNVETDNDLRDRIRGAASRAGKATSEAIKQTLVGINGLQSVSVDDLPLFNVYGPTGSVRTQEAHVMNVASGRTRLNFDILNLNNLTSPTNIIIADSYDDDTPDYTYGASNNYHYDEDLRSIVWDITTPGTTCPINGSTFYVGYQVNLLGNVQVYVAGFASPLSSNISTKIDEAIENVKAAGVTVNWSEANVININVTCSVVIDTDGGFNELTVREQVQEAIILWLNAKDVGDNVLLAEFYEAVMAVEGVTNVTLSNWDGDTSAPFNDITIGFNQVARPEDGMITVN